MAFIVASLCFVFGHWHAMWAALCLLCGAFWALLMAEHIADASAFHSEFIDIQNTIAGKIKESLAEKKNIDLKEASDLFNEISEAQANAAKAFTETLPWYYRMLSTAGVLAFVVMLVTATSQLFVASSELKKAEVIKESTEYKNNQLAAVTKDLESSSRTIFDTARQLGQSLGPLNRAGRESACKGALMFYNNPDLARLPGFPTHLEFMQWALLCKDWNVVEKIYIYLTGCPGNEVQGADIMALALAHSVFGERQQVESCLRRLDDQAFKPAGFFAHVQLQALRSLGIPSGKSVPDNLVGSIMVFGEMDQVEARRLLELHVEHLKDGRSGIQARNE